MPAYQFRVFLPAVMGPLDVLNHLLNFVAPACVVGTLLAVVSPFFVSKSAQSHDRIAQAAINSVAGMLALSAGLWLFGRDGKMASYAMLAVACASSQWWALRR